jgi:sugar phosphate permease
LNTANVAAIEAAPKELAGSAAGTTSMMRYIGGVLGAGILGLILSSGGAAPSVAVFRILFAALLLTSFIGGLASVSIHKFVNEPEPEVV